MKIVLNEAGAIVARHVDAAHVTPAQYADFGPVLIGTVPDSMLAQDSRGNDTYNGSVIDAARDLARQMVRERVGMMLADLADDYPQAERDTWAAKLAEAKAVQADDKAETVYLAAVAKRTGKSVAQVAKSVIEKATAYAEALADAEAYRGNRYAAIDKAKNVKAIVAAMAE